jgi:hypothetical protein
MPGTNGLTSNPPPQYDHAWKFFGTGIGTDPVSDFSETFNSSPLMQFDITSFPKTQKDATPPDKSRIEGICRPGATPMRSLPLRPSRFFVFILMRLPFK